MAQDEAVCGGIGRFWAPFISSSNKAEPHINVVNMLKPHHTSKTR